MVQMNLFAKDSDTDIVNKSMDTKGEMEVDELGDWDWYRYTIDTMYKTGNLLDSTENSTECSVVT